MNALSITEGTIEEVEYRWPDELPQSATRFRQGDILVAKISPSLENGKIAIASDIGADLAYASSEFHVVRPGPLVTSRWLWYLLRHPESRRFLTLRMIGSSGQRRVPADILRRFPVPIPSLSVQHQVVSWLDEAHEAIQNSKRAEQHVAPLATSLFIELFGEPYANPMAWPRVPLGADHLGISFAYGTSKRAAPDGDGTPVLRIPNVVKWRIDEDDIFTFVSLPVNDRAKLELRDGDILAVRSNGNPEFIGRAAIYEGHPSEAVFASYLIRMRVSGNAILPDVIWAWLQTQDARHQLLRHAATTAGQFNISVRGLRDLLVPQPPVSMQRQCEQLMKECRTLARRQRTRSANLQVLLDRLVESAIGVGDAIRSSMPTVEDTHGQPVHSLLPVRRRRVTDRLSSDQRDVWSACLAMAKRFDLTMITQQFSKAYDRRIGEQRLIGILELLAEIGGLVKDTRDDMDLWHVPDHSEDQAEIVRDGA